MDLLISLTPPLAAVVLALVTRRVNLSLFLAIWVGGWFVAGDPISAVGQSFDWFAKVMTDEWNARFLVLVSLLGAGAAFMYRTGGSNAVARWLSARVATGRSAQLLTWVLGLVIFFNDYVNSVIVVSVQKRRFHISRTQRRSPRRAGASSAQRDHEAGWASFNG